MFRDVPRNIQMQMLWASYYYLIKGKTYKSQERQGSNQESIQVQINQNRKKKKQTNKNIEKPEEK